MNPRFAITVLALASLCLSIAANAATPLGKVTRLDETDPTIVAHKDIALTIAHKNKAFKIKTAKINAVMMSKIKLNSVIVTKGGSK